MKISSLFKKILTLGAVSSMFFFGSSFNHNVQADSSETKIHALNVPNAYDWDGDSNIESDETTNFECYIIDPPKDLDITLPMLKQFAFAGEDIVKKAGSVGVNKNSQAHKKNFRPIIRYKIVDITDGEITTGDTVKMWTTMNDTFSFSKTKPGHSYRIYVVIDDANDQALNAELNAQLGLPNTQEQQQKLEQT